MSIDSDESPLEVSIYAKGNLAQDRTTNQNNKLGCQCYVSLQEERILSCVMEVAGPMEDVQQLKKVLDEVGIENVIVPEEEIPNDIIKQGVIFAAKIGQELSRVDNFRDELKRHLGNRCLQEQRKSSLPSKIDSHINLIKKYLEECPHIIAGISAWMSDLMDLLIQCWEELSKDKEVQEAITLLKENETDTKKGVVYFDTRLGFSLLQPVCDVVEKKLRAENKDQFTVLGTLLQKLVVQYASFYEFELSKGQTDQRDLDGEASLKPSFNSEGLREFKTALDYLSAETNQELSTLNPVARETCKRINSFNSTNLLEFLEGWYDANENESIVNEIVSYKWPSSMNDFIAEKQSQSSDRTSIDAEKQQNFSQSLIDAKMLLKTYDGYSRDQFVQSTNHLSREKIKQFFIRNAFKIAKEKGLEGQELIDYFRLVRQCDTVKSRYYFSFFGKSVGKSQASIFLEKVIKFAEDLQKGLKKKEKINLEKIGAQEKGLQWCKVHYRGIPFKDIMDTIEKDKEMSIEKDKKMSIENMLLSLVELKESYLTPLEKVKSKLSELEDNSKKSDVDWELHKRLSLKERKLDEGLQSLNEVEEVLSLVRSKKGLDCQFKNEPLETFALRTIRSAISNLEQLPKKGKQVKTVEAIKRNPFFVPISPASSTSSEVSSDRSSPGSEIPFFCLPPQFGASDELKSTSSTPRMNT
ncbi:Dot/Icm T4SS effector CetCb3 [Coxiella burnetii]|uniref:Dot/Icm T4SS effector CetCb3 n=1 Tax=Coxiella burnetii TaxID=777 RepID=UPI0002DD11FA|nr:Dot/Icm T4SS effector CetCb3 [Coxiella burnetii]ATN74082.1 hypothetical protein AYM90_03115 [Coxiella burnetii]ATN75987.1 hypothetical protein AYM94_03095 [Coxiella burnetii]ATN77901.1 hypothetical protein AYM93_03085 [Coxiella burnetii]ATN79817.1 hypothetical protein AYN00_03100 [Coxiella burnetii]ATN83702.1 hypothetical protein AYO23_03445 [Coxiella burnetii]